MLRRLGKKSARIAFGVLLAVLIGEIALRIVGFSYPSFYTFDEHTAGRLRPGAEGWYREEGESYVIVNAAGMRDEREITEAKGTDEYRVAVLGDSVVEAIQVPVDKTFVRLVEARLNECKPFGQRRVRLMNFGVSGFSTAQELQTLRHRVWAYQPDLVVLSFFSLNDVRDNQVQYFHTSPEIPFFRFGPDNALVLDESFLQMASVRSRSSTRWRTLQAVSDYSRILQLLNRAKNMRNAKAQEKDQAATGTQPTGDLGPSDLVLAPPHTKEWEDCWAMSEALVKQIRDEVVEHGARFVLVLSGSGPQEHPDPTVRAETMKRIGMPDLFYPEMRLGNFADKNGIEVISLARPMQEWAEANKTFTHGFSNAALGAGHWNENGHRVAANLIGDKLCQPRP